MSWFRTSHPDAPMVAPPQVEHVRPYPIVVLRDDQLDLIRQIVREELGGEYQRGYRDGRREKSYRPGTR